MKFALRFSDRAIQDIEEVLAFTLENFGRRKYDEYRHLIHQALADIAENPDQLPAKHRTEIHKDARTFHIARRGRRARHFILYRMIGDSHIDIGRLLQDSMEIKRHLPEGFNRASS